jgi:hypothetical protein
VVGYVGQCAGDDRGWDFPELSSRAVERMMCSHHTIMKHRLGSLTLARATDAERVDQRQQVIEIRIS